MNFIRKITRLLYKTLKYAFILVLILLVFVIITVNTPSFQTWLAHKASAYLSDKIGATVSIGKVHLSFVRSAELEDVFIEDKNKDTLLYSRAITATFSNFDFVEKTLKINDVELHQTKVHLIKHKGTEDFNYEFLVEYFSSSDTTSSGPSAWRIDYGDVALKNVDFIYRNENKNIEVSENMNFNNIHAKNIYGVISGVHLIHDSIYADISKLECIEQCGLVLDNLTTKAKICSKRLVCKDLYLETPNSTLIGELSFNYKHWGDYLEFIDSVSLNGNFIDTTKINFKDIAYFAEALNGLDKSILFNGKINGLLSDLKGENIKILFENNTKFQGDFSISGLPVVKNMFIHLDVDKLSVTKGDLEKIPSYPFTEKKLLKVPAELAKLGIVHYRGKYDGFINDFTTYGTFKTALGDLGTDLSVHVDSITNLFSYNGKIRSTQFNIGKLFDINKLGNVSLDAKIVGKGLTLQKIEAKLEGNIYSIAYNNYAYKNISINGEIKNKIFKGDLVSKDENANFDFDGKIDFTEKIPTIDFISTVNKLNLRRLGLIEGYKNGDISSQILINLKGNNIDNLTGEINFDNTVYTTAEKEFKLSTFDLLLEQSTAKKDIKINSNYFNLAVDGVFDLSRLPGAFNQFLSVYYPTFVSPIRIKGKPELFDDAFNFKITIKKFKTINELFVHNLMISPNSVIDGDFDATKNLFNINLKSDSIRYSSLRFNNNTIKSFSKNNKINLVITGDNIQLSDSLKLNNYFMYLVSNDKGTKFNLEWDNKIKPSNAGRFFGRVNFENKVATITYETIFVTAHDSTWRLTETNPTTIDSSGFVLVNPLRLVNNTQMINIQGTLSNRPNDKLDFNLSNFDLSQLNPFLVKSKLDLNGKVNGTLSLHNTLKDLAFSSDLKFEKLALNKNELGDGGLKTEYNSFDKYLYVDGYTSLGLIDPKGEKLKNISFSGYYYINKTEESLDINFDAKPANLKILNPFLEGILTIKNGLVIGEGKVSGTPENPAINGKFKLDKCDLKVDYLNTVYNLSGDVEVLPDQIRFDEVKIYDGISKKVTHNGTINGNIFHDRFQNLRIDFDINFNNMIVLNTTNVDGASFYGKAFASGNTGIYGFVNDVKIEVRNLVTEKGTQFNIPMDGPAEVSENSFIRFVKRDTIKKKEQEKKSGFSLDMALKVTPDAEAQIIFDAKSGDVIKARGNGDLSLKITNLGKFDMFGEYSITSGEYLFTLENFITKKFEIQKGSNITWSGSPYNAEIDIIANYKQRASISPLVLGDSSKRRYPVICKLLMNDKLTSPNITFGIELPTIDENTRSKIKSILTDEAEMNRQVFSLLLLNSFVTPLIYSQAGGVSAGNAIAANGSEMLSNRINGWLSGLTNQIDIGVNYRPGGQLSSDELDVALSKQLLNNRLTVDGNLGVNNNKNSNSNGLIGDVNVEYKITDDGRYRIKGFNRSNDNTQLTTSGGPFTQGVGVFYREEFETWSDLYKRYINKLKSLGKKKSSEEVKK